MTEDKIIALARLAGFTWEPIGNVIGPLERFAELVAAEEKLNHWKQAIINELIVSHILRADHNTDPRKALAALIDYECKVTQENTNGV